MTLMLLFEKTVCVLTTSAPVEHIFTPCERILRPHRAVHIWETRCSLTCRLGVLSAISIFVTTRDIDSFLCYSYWIDYLQYDLNSLLLTALDLILASYVIIVFLALVLRVMSLALAGLGQCVLDSNTPTGILSIVLSSQCTQEHVWLLRMYRWPVYGYTCSNHCSIALQHNTMTYQRHHAIGLLYTWILTEKSRSRTE